DMPGVVENILQIAPGTTNIAFVMGSSPYEKYWKELLLPPYERFTNRVSFTWFDNLTFEQILERSKTMPPHSFIALLLLMRDASGVTHDLDDALRRLHVVANAPITSLFEHQLGLGIIGGKLYQSEFQGIEAARVAVRVLRGEPVTN